MDEVKEKKPKKRYVYLDKYEKLEDRVRRVEKLISYLIIGMLGVGIYLLTNVIIMYK